MPSPVKFTLQMEEEASPTPPFLLKLCQPHISRAAELEYMIQDSSTWLSMVTLGRIQSDFAKEKRKAIHPRKLRHRIFHAHFQPPWSSDCPTDTPNSFPPSSLLLFLSRIFFPQTFTWFMPLLPAGGPCFSVPSARLPFIAISKSGAPTPGTP